MMKHSWLLILVLTAQCGTPTGTVQVVLVPEDTIPDGLDPGTGEESIVDGWTVRYDKFVVAIGNFRARRSARPSAPPLSAANVSVVDFRRAPEGGFVLAEFKQVPADRWDRVGYDTPRATASAERAEFTEQPDYDRMVGHGLSHFVVGRVFDDEAACSEGTRDPAHCKTFAWELVAPTSLDDCANATGAAGFAVPSGGTQAVKPTVHGDHWFFTTITQGTEIVQRRAQWIVDGDVDGDGEVTLDELKTRPAATAFPSSLGYNLSGGFRGPIHNAYDYLLEQASTLGDYNGDGECPTRGVL